LDENASKSSTKPPQMTNSAVVVPHNKQGSAETKKVVEVSAKDFDPKSDSRPSGWAEIKLRR
jgi:hypothetical protein